MFNKKAKTSEEFIEELKKLLPKEQEINDSSNDKKEKNSILYQIDIPRLCLDEVILSKSTRLQLEEGMAKLRFHKIIYEDWNFQKIDKQGKAVILNFFGEPGTGKTLTAEGFAGSINKSIIKLGIAELESKFMGET